MEHLRRETRFILVARDGRRYRHRDGRLMTWPSYTSALRGRAIIDCNALIIQQELVSEEPT
jgi:hypothetical protein